MSQEIVLPIGVVVFILKALWDMISDKQKKNTKAIEELTKAVNLLQLAVVKLETQIDILNDRAAEIPAIKSDLNALGQKVRGLGN